MTHPTMWSVRRVADPSAMIDFLVRAFGFVQTARYDHDGVVVHAELQRPDGRGGLMLGAASQESAWAQQVGAFGAYVVVDDVEALHERAVAAGAEVTQPPHDTDYGSREVAFRDPEGGLWSFGTHIGEPLPH